MTRQVPPDVLRSRIETLVAEKLCGPFMRPCTGCVRNVVLTKDFRDEEMWRRLTSRLIKHIVAVLMGEIDDRKTELKWAWARGQANDPDGSPGPQVLVHFDAVRPDRQEHEPALIEN